MKDESSKEPGAENPMEQKQARRKEIRALDFWAEVYALTAEGTATASMEHAPAEEDPRPWKRTRARRMRTMNFYHDAEGSAPAAYESRLPVWR